MRDELCCAIHVASPTIGSCSKGRECIGSSRRGTHTKLRFQQSMIRCSSSRQLSSKENLDFPDAASPDFAAAALQARHCAVLPPPVRRACRPVR